MKTDQMRKELAKMFPDGFIVFYPKDADNIQFIYSDEGKPHSILERYFKASIA